MQFNLRLASQQSRQDYPLPINGEALWQAGTSHPPGRSQKCKIKLPNIPEQHIIVPSFCLLGPPYSYEFSLVKEGLRIPLHPVPNQADYQPPEHDKSHATPHIDCWHTETQLNDAYVQLEVNCPEPVPELEHLISISVRPLNLSKASDSGRKLGELWPEPICINISKHYSQMQAAEASIRRRICSPTALAMCLSNNPDAPDWPATVEACYDPFTKAYGSWPRAIYWAGAHRCLAAVETFIDWQEPVELLSRGYALVCSIRWEKDGLQGAPMPASAGHLVLLHGIDTKTGEALVLDPAAATDGEVSRRYRLDQFGHAWLAHRGAAYVLAHQIPKNGS